MEPVRLYVGDDYREEKLFTHVELLFPFWGVTAKESMPYVRAASLKHQYSAEDFTLVQKIEDADYVLMPYQYDRFKAVNPEKVARIEREAEAAGKPLLIDGSGDNEFPIPVKDAVILRVSQYAYSKKDNEITIPFAAEDLLELHCNGEMNLRKKPEIASVGFTGWAAIPLKTRLKIYAKEAYFILSAHLKWKRGAEVKGILFRERALEALSRSSKITTNFTVRQSYSGHAKTIQGSFEDNRIQFVRALLESDYALCIKGDANASVRFYEALSLGRIPLFLDTDCVLPLEDSIDYREFCVFIDWKDIDSIDTLLAAFNAQCTAEQFERMQKKARDAFATYLRIDSFSPHLARQLRDRLAHKS